MSLRAIPLMALAFILYNVLALTGLDLQRVLFSVPMPSNVSWAFRVSDLIILITMVLLFIELLKSTYTSASSLVDHGLSMLITIACLIEFMLVPQAATSAFFFILIATIIDVIAGFTIGIRVAKRDIGFSAGGGDH
jgi:hypothetical protein